MIETLELYFLSNPGKLAIFGEIIDMADIIALSISGISLTISIFIFFRTWWIERYRIDFEIVKWFGGNNGIFFLWLYVSNKSKLPCSILEIKVEGLRNGKKISAIGQDSKRRIAITTESNRDPIDHFSFDFPVYLNAYDSIGGYFHLVSSDSFINFEDVEVNLTVRTNRGSTSKKIFLDYGKNIFRVMQLEKNEVKGIVKTREDGSIINFYKDGRI